MAISRPVILPLMPSHACFSMAVRQWLFGGFLAGTMAGLSAPRINWDVFLMLSAEKQFIFYSEKAALCAAKAVRMEFGRAHEKRAFPSIDTNKNVVLLRIVARDEAALKASLGSYSRLLGLCADFSLIGGSVDG